MKHLKKLKEYLLENKEQVPIPIKKLCSLIYDKIKNEEKSFSIYFDFTKKLYFPISFNLNVEFIKNPINEYNSKIDTLSIIEKEFENFEIPIIISDERIQLNRLMSIIHHELRHIYDLITNTEDYDIESFYMNPVIFKMKQKYPKFKYFFDLVYLSTEHELVARNSMLYNYLRYMNIFDKEILYNEYTKTKSYEYLQWLKDFDYNDFIKSFDKTELINASNEFIELINKYRKEKLLKIINDEGLHSFYEKWQNSFKEKSEEYDRYVYSVIDDVINDVKKYNEDLEPVRLFNENWCYQDRKYKNYLEYISNIL
jgi:hypothetical protein